MVQEEWFDTLEFAYPVALRRGDTEGRRTLLAALTALEKLLGWTAGKQVISDIKGLYSFSLPARLSAEERKWAERLAERLWRATGSGRVMAEQVLLGQVGVQASPDSLPFFRAALETNRARDSFQARRRRIAVASVAFIAHKTGDAAAYAQIEAWLTHPDITVRTEAANLYGRLWLEDGGRRREAALVLLERVAYEERAFAPRFLARGWLQSAGVEVRVEPPDGVYVFKASLGRASRTVELKASQALPELASAILDAFDWDHDHLYEFALTGDLKDRRFILPDTEHEAFAWDWSLDEEGEEVPPESTDPAASTGTSSPMALPLGAFGLIKGHEFIFRYDFGDDRRFRVRVEDIQEHRSPGVEYPRVVAETGKAPEQYPFFA